jgi:hypothetical protein
MSISGARPCGVIKAVLVAHTFETPLRPRTWRRHWASLRRACATSVGNVETTHAIGRFSNPPRALRPGRLGWAADHPLARESLSLRTFTPSANQFVPHFRFAALASQRATASLRVRRRLGIPSAPTTDVARAGGAGNGWRVTSGMRLSGFYHGQSRVLNGHALDGRIENIC